MRSASEMELPYRVISNKTMRMIASGFKDLEKLDLSHRALSETGIGYLGQCKNLKVLDLSQVLLQDGNSDKVVKFIVDRCKNLIELDISGWDFKDKKAVLEYMKKHCLNLAKLIAGGKVKNDLNELKMKKVWMAIELWEMEWSLAFYTDSHPGCSVSYTQTLECNGKKHTKSVSEKVYRELKQQEIDKKNLEIQNLESQIREREKNSKR